MRGSFITTTAVYVETLFFCPVSVLLLRSPLFLGLVFVPASLLFCLERWNFQTKSSLKLFGIPASSRSSLQTEAGFSFTAELLFSLKALKALRKKEKKK